MRQNILETARSAVGWSLFALCLAATGGQAAPTVTASLDRQSIEVGETATLRLVFTGGAPQRPPMIRADHLTIQYRGPGQHVSIQGGQVISTVTHSYSVRANAPGRHTIPAVGVEIDGQALTTQPLRLTVRERAPSNQPEPAFLLLEAPKKEVYVGEVVPVELQLYVQAAQDIQLPQLPAEGFTVGAISREPRRTQTRRDGILYNLFIWEIPVTAVRSGQLSLGAATASLTLLTGPRDIFGRHTQGRTVTVESERQTMTARNLPREGLPENFNGAIGRFSLDLKASPTEVAVGDPITLRVQIAGRGTIDAVQLPQQSGWDDFRLYPPTSRVEHSDRAGLAGIKSFEKVISPQRAGITELPPFTFSYFDPDEQEYRTLTHPAIALTVRPSAGSQPAGNARRRNAPPTEIVHIKPDLGRLAGLETPLVQRPWFVLLQGMGPLALIASFVWRRQRERLANNPRLRRQREVGRRARAGLADLRAQAAAQCSDEFFATTFRLLQEQIGERLDLPASAITEAVLDEKLRPRGLDEPALETLHELFRACNRARYAPQRSSQELAALIPKIETALRRLQKLPA